MRGRKKSSNYVIVILGWIFLVLGLVLTIGGAVSELIIKIFRKQGLVIVSTNNLDIPLFKIIYCSIGGIFAIIGAVFLLVTMRNKKKKKRLIENGRKYYAEVIGAIINYQVQVNRKYPYRLDCKYIDEITGVTYLYRSGNVWENPDQYIGLQVPVYVNRDKPKEYYVAVEELSISNGAMFCDYR
ncbi:DUF3592 domain-containing protein [Anaerosporobacter sp.]